MRSIIISVFCLFSLQVLLVEAAEKVRRQSSHEYLTKLSAKYVAAKANKTMSAKAKARKQKMSNAITIIKF